MIDGAALDLIRAQISKATPGPWLLAYDRLKNAIATDKAGRVLVDGESAYHEDIKLIVLMHEHMPALLDAARNTEAAHERALIQIEKDRTDERQKYDRDMAGLRAELADVSAELARQTVLAAERGQQLERAAAEIEQRDKNHPMVAAAREFKRFGHRGNLIAAFDRWCALSGVRP